MCGFADAGGTADDQNGFVHPANVTAKFLFFNRFPLRRSDQPAP
jgi:hypothetical protein